MFGLLGCCMRFWTHVQRGCVSPIALSCHNYHTVATAGLLLYAVLVGPLLPHDGLGALLSGLLIG
jgi:hypothetical protein